MMSRCARAALRLSNFVTGARATCSAVPSYSFISVAPVSTSSRILSQEQTQSKRDLLEHHANKLKKSTPRKRRPITASLTRVNREPSVVSIAIAESFDLHSIINDTEINSLFDVKYIDEEFENCLYLVKKLEYTVNPGELSEIYVFEDGVVVFWNVESSQRVQLLRSHLEQYASSPHDSRIAMDEQDRMPFSIISGDSCIRSDRFNLSEERHGSGNKAHAAILERFALSQGFAASVKVGVWEAILSDMSEPLSSSTKALKEGIIPWSRREALVKSGEFAALRHTINLDCDLLNRDFYWERSDVEKFYLMSERHFALPRRLKLLNSRLDYCEELVKMVDNMLALRHASTLEWMIIVLIVIEVIFDIFHFADRSPKKVIVVESNAVTAPGPEVTP